MTVIGFVRLLTNMSDYRITVKSRHGYYFATYHLVAVTRWLSELTATMMVG